MKRSLTHPHAPSLFLSLSLSRSRSVSQRERERAAKVERLAASVGGSQGRDHTHPLNLSLTHSLSPTHTGAAVEQRAASVGGSQGGATAVTRDTDCCIHHISVLFPPLQDLVRYVSCVCSCMCVQYKRMVRGVCTVAFFTRQSFFLPVQDLVVYVSCLCLCLCLCVCVWRMSVCVLWGGYD